MSVFRYDGSPLTRGEFITHMTRLEQAVGSIDERVAGIEERLNRTRRMMLSAAAATAARIGLWVVTIALTFAAARYGIPLP